MATGRLIYLIGPSGAGKDSLIAEATRRLQDRSNLRFPRRTITRAPGHEGEIYNPIDETDFHALAERGAFVLTWQSHGYHYGLPASILEDMACGKQVIVNGSRGALDRARAAVDRLLPVYVWVQPEILAARLHRRGREDEAEIYRRLERGAAFAIPDDAAIIDNSGPLESAVSNLCRIIGTDQDQDQPRREGETAKQ